MVFTPFTQRRVGFTIKVNLPANRFRSFIVVQAVRARPWKPIAAVHLSCLAYTELAVTIVQGCLRNVLEQKLAHTADLVRYAGIGWHNMCVDDIRQNSLARFFG